MKKKKIKVLYLLLFPFYGSGSGTFARFLAKEVSKKNTVAIVSPDTRPIDGVKLYPLKMPFKVAFTGHPEWKNCKLFSELSETEIMRLHKSFMESAVEAVEDFKPDLIHVHHIFPLSWSARFIHSTYGIPYIVTSHGSGLACLEIDKRYYGLTSDALHGASYVTSVSINNRSKMVKTFSSINNRKLRTISGGVKIDTFYKVNSKAIAKEFNLTGKKIILFAGKLTKFKGVEYLVKAAKQIRGEVVISGGGPEKKHLMQIVKDEKISNVHFLGHIDTTERLVQLYSLADIFVAPSIWDDPMPLTILEAMATHCAMVVTKKGGIPLAVRGGYNGLFITPKSSNDIALKVNMLLKNEVLMKKMGERSREIAKKKFTWEDISSRFNGIYDRMVK